MNEYFNDSNNINSNINSNVHVVEIDTLIYNQRRQHVNWDREV